MFKCPDMRFFILISKFHQLIQEIHIRDWGFIHIVVDQLTSGHFIFIIKVLVYINKITEIIA